MVDFLTILLINGNSEKRPGKAIRLMQLKFLKVKHVLKSNYTRLCEANDSFPIGYVEITSINSVDI